MLLVHTVRLAVSFLSFPFSTWLFESGTDGVVLGGDRPGDGTVFPVDKEKLRKLREITTEVRMQGEAGSPESASSLD